MKTCEPWKRQNLIWKRYIKICAPRGMLQETKVKAEKICDLPSE